MFKNKTFETITAPLRKMIQDLRAHAIVKTEEGYKAEETINAMIVKHTECLDEADCAMETADNIANLIGEPTTASQL